MTVFLFSSDLYTRTSEHSQSGPAWESNGNRRPSR